MHCVLPFSYIFHVKIIISDIQAFLDASQEEHIEISRWGFETRLRLSRGALATLRDCGLLKGEVNKYIVLPIIPEGVIHHLIRLLKAEGIPQEQMAYHPDWRLWLWSPAQAKAAIDNFLKQEQIA